MTRLLPLILALPVLSIPMVPFSAADEVPEPAPSLLTCESNPIQVVMYLGPRGWQVEGDRQELDAVGGKVRHTQGRNDTAPPLQDSQANPLAVQEVLVRHLGADGKDHPFAAYDQAAWRQLAQEIPAEENVMRLVMTRDGLVLCSMEIPMGTPSSLEHAHAQEAARALWQDLYELHLVLMMTQELTYYPNWNLEVTGFTLPDQGGCPGPIFPTPLETQNIEWLPTLLED